MTNPISYDANKRYGPLLAVYSYFRIVLAIILIGVSLLEGSDRIREDISTSIFMYVAFGYFTATILQAVLHHAHKFEYSLTLIFFAILIDEMFILALMYFGDTFSNEISILQVIPIAIASMFFSGSLATIYAALAALATIAITLHFSLENTIKNDQFIQSGILGIVFFGISFAMQTIARRIDATEKEAYISEQNAQEMAVISHHIVQRIRTGLIIFDTNGKAILANDAAREYLGVASIDQIENTDLHPLYKNWITDNKIHYQYLKFESDLNDIQISFSFLNYKEHVITFIDSLAEVSQQAQQIKLASLGRLSASIAHEIRNPLSAISHSFQLLHESSDLSKDDMHLLDISGKHITRIDNTISNILNMSKSQDFNPSKINLNDVLNNIKQEYEEQNPKDIKFILESGTSNIEVPFDEVQLTQILNNLIDNALLFSYKKTKCYFVKIIIMEEQSQPYRPVIINIYDDGPGIPIEKSDKIFEPFYTTEASGTGLGLYISRELCTLNQSQLDYIQGDNGHYFQIRFPHPNRNIILKNH